MERVIVGRQRFFARQRIIVVRVGFVDGALLAFRCLI
jgi:hypothetical protein